MSKLGPNQRAVSGQMHLLACVKSIVLLFLTLSLFLLSLMRRTLVWVVCQRCHQVQQERDADHVLATHAAYHPGPRQVWPGARFAGCFCRMGTVREMKVGQVHLDNIFF